MCRREESVAASVALDYEEGLQMDYCLWVYEHPDAETQGRCSLIISKHLEIVLYGLRWHLRNLDKSRTVEGSRQRGAFSVDRLEIVGESRTPIWAGEDDNISGLGTRVYGDVEEAQSLGEVLDALNDFSVWFGKSLRELHGETHQQRRIVNNPAFSVQSERAMYLKMQAKEASAMCETAKEALREASKAAANVLGECYNSHVLVSNREPAPVPAKSSYSGNGSEASGCAWGKRLRRSEAVANGFVLQWCSVDACGRSSYIECKMQVGELLVEEDEIEAARRVGIAIDKPLLIRIGLDFESLKISQDEVLKSDQVTTLMRGDFLLREIVKKELPWYYSSLKSRGNVLVRMLEEVAGYVSGLKWRCAVCGHAKGDHVDQQLVSPCTLPLCEARFGIWGAYGRRLV